MSHEIIVNCDGKQEWFLDGKRHRENGPAVEYPNGTREWYFNGKLHRTTGPAIEFFNGEYMWYINNQRLTEWEFNIITQAADGEIVEINGVRYRLISV